MKRYIRPLVIILASFIPVASYAMLPSDLQSINYRTAFYDTNYNCAGGATALGGPSGSGPLTGPDFPQVSDTADLANRINTYIANTTPSSPFINMGANFVTSGQKYNINPAMIVAFAQKESSLGTNQPSGSFDAFGLTANGDVPGAPYKNGITYLPSWVASIDIENKYLSDNYVHGGFNANTVLAIMNHYTPSDSSDPTRAQDQTNETLDIMNKIFNGISTAPGATPPPNTQVTDPCSGQTTGVTSAGAFGWNITGPNSMVTYNMEDPKWANLPYPPSGTIGVDGCGPTAIAMVLATLTGNSSITPVTIANKYGNQYHGAGGTDWSLFPVAASDYGLKGTDLGTNLTAAAQIIKQGGLVIISVNAGYFTSEGHIMVIRAISPDGGSFYLNDPAAPGPAGHGNDNNQAFTAAFLQTQGNMAHLWGYTK